MKNYDIQEVGAMTESILMNMDAIIYVDRFAVGANDGGRYVSLFNSKLDLRLINVYHENFNRLPPFIKGRIEELADDVDIPVKLSAATKQNRVIECTKFKATRYRRPLKAGESATDSPWRFGAVLRVFGPNRDIVKEKKAEPEDPLITVDQLNVLRGYLDAIFDDKEERDIYAGACLAKFNAASIDQVRQSQVMLWKKYLDDRLQAKFNGQKIQSN